MDVKSALIIVVFLSLLDIVFTHEILKIHIRRNPNDKNWPELEMNRNAKWVFKRYGLGITSLMLNIAHSLILMTIFFGFVYIFNWDLAFFVYTILGGLAFVNISHYEHYKRLKNDQYPYNQRK